MARLALIPVGLLLVLLAASQLLLPPFLEGRVSDRLERGGGSADVSLKAVPAGRLLFHDGDELDVNGRGLRLELGGRGETLDRLDGFDEVHVRLTDADAEPLRVRRFALTRSESDRDYAVRMAGSTTPREVARFLGSQAAGSLGGTLGDLATELLPDGGEVRVPVDMEATVRSRNGRREVTSATGSVAGVPAGPLVQLVLDAVVRSL
jgi:hypothetical protein